MKFKVVSKRLIYIDEGYNLVKGENNNELVTIEMPRYPNGTDTDYMSLSHRLTVTSVENSEIAAVSILTKEELDSDKIRLMCPITSEITSVGNAAFFKVTSVGSNDFIDITECETPIKINNNTDEDRFPSEIDMQKILRAFQLAADEAKDIALEAKNIAQTAENAASLAAESAQSAKEFSQTAEENAVKTDTAAQNVANSVSEFNEKTEEVLNDQTEMKKILAEIKSYICYTDNDIIGLYADFENGVFTRLGAAVGKNAGSDFNVFPMYGGRKRCNVLDDGTITAYYGDDNFIEDGSNGQVMVYQPKFYYKVVPLKLDPQTNGYGYHIRSANYYISAVPKNGFKLHPAFYGEDGKPVDYILFSAYEGSVYDTSAEAYLVNDEQIADFSADKLSSVTGVKPCSGKNQNLSRANAEQLAKNRGKGWHGITIKAESANQILMIIEFASFNMQGSVGNGNVSADSPIVTGKTSILGNSSGMTTEKAVSYRGMENSWGNMWEFIHGLNIYGDGKKKGGIPYICSNFDFSENKTNDNYFGADFTLTNTSGFVSAFGYSEKCDWLFLASESLGDSNSPIGDYQYIFSNLNGYKTALLSGYWQDNLRAGAFCFSLSNYDSFHYFQICSRLIYVPTSAV